MEDSSETICRLCFKIPVSNFESIDDVTQLNLNFLLLNLDLAISNNSVVCESCVKNLKRCIDFKVKCLCTEDHINLFLKDKHDLQVDLREIYINKNHNEKLQELFYDHNVCRFCMELVKFGSFVNFIGNKILTEKLEKFFPELNLGVTKDPIMCIRCYESLQNHFTFISECLTAEEKIKKYHEVEGTNSKSYVELNTVLHFTPKCALNSENVSSNLIVSPIKLEEIGYGQEDDACEKVEVKNESTVDIEQELDIKEDVFADIEQSGHLRFQDYILEQPNTVLVSNKAVLGKTMYECKICQHQTKCKGNFKKHMQSHQSMLEDLMSVHEYVSCKLCCKSLQKAFDFLNCCLRTEKTIKEYCEGNRKNGGGPIDLAEALQSSLDVLKRSEKTWLHTETDLDNVEDNSSENEKLQDLENKPDVKNALNWKKGKNRSESFQKTKVPCQENSKRKKHLWVKALKKRIKETKTYNCQKCGFTSWTKQVVDNHLLKHKDPSEVTMLKCDKCTFETKYNGSMVKHRLLHESSDASKKHKCNVCEYRTRNPADLRRHMRRHMDPTNLPLFKCSECPFESKYKESLKYHCVIHKESELFKCTYCLYVTKHKRYLDAHMNIHKDPSQTMKTTYKCEICTFTTKYRSSLKAHGITHKDASEVVLYNCTDCDFITKHKRALRQHNLVHKNLSEAKVYICYKCNFTCKFRTRFIKHLAVHKD